MEELISPGDLVYTLKNFQIVDYRRTDVLAFKKDMNTTFIKRVVAIPKDTIFFKRNFFKIKGSKIPHDPIFEMMVEESDHPDSISYFSARTYSEYLLSKSVSPNNMDKYIIENGNALIVPNDYYFMVGDNYYESMDSRFWGFIPKENIKGKVVFIF
jgi:signal peptidase I